MAVRIEESEEIVMGAPVVKPSDELFWFNRPRLILYLINFVFFQSAFQLAFTVWTLYEFGVGSCLSGQTWDVVIRLTMGVLVQIWCGYATFPLYALVTQMGSKLKVSIYDERIAEALRNWHCRARYRIEQIKEELGKIDSDKDEPHETNPVQQSPVQQSPVHQHEIEIDAEVELTVARREQENQQAAPNIDRQVSE